MPDLTAKRTLVKSPPELWEELSEVDRLAKHLSAFGEITITKLEPEHTVAWEGERASGTVSIEPSGWGTKVTLHAELPEPDEQEPEPDPEQAPAEPAAEAPIEEPEVGTQESAVEPEAELEAEPEVEPEVEPTRRRGFWGWLFRERTDSPARAVMAAEAEPVAAEAEPVAAEPEPSVPEPSEPKPSEPEPSVPDPSEAEPSAPEPVEAIADEAEPPADDPEPEPEPGPLDAEPAQPDGPVALDPERALVILDEALDTLGAAHHRPFSRG